MTKKQKLTIDDIARDLGVSKTTVSRAISGKGRIGAETRAKITDYVHARNYFPNAAAKSLADKRSYNLALVLDDKVAPARLQQTVHAVWEDANRRDYNVLLFFNSEEGISALTQVLANRKADGVILTEKNASLAAVLKQRQIPFVSNGDCRELLQKLLPADQSR